MKVFITSFLVNQCSVCLCCQINGSIFTILSFNFFFLAFWRISIVKSRLPVTLTKFFDSFGKTVSTKLSFYLSLISLCNFNSFALCFLLCLSWSDTFTKLRRLKFIFLSNFLWSSYVSEDFLLDVYCYRSSSTKLLSAIFKAEFHLFMKSLSRSLSLFLYLFFLSLSLSLSI